MVEQASRRMNRHQSGSALILGLVLLMILTVLALSSMRSGVMQEKMVSAQLDANAAYEGAEHALREAETFLRSKSPDELTPLFATDGSGRYGATSTTFPEGNAFFDTSKWTATASVQVSKPAVGNAELVAEQPQYMIRHVGDISAAAAGVATMPLNMGNHTNNIAPAGGGKLFRIVARSTGRSGESARVLEQYFVRGQD